MGKGDKRTKRGKITIGSFGKSRPTTSNSNASKSESKVEKKDESKAETKA